MDFASTKVVYILLTNRTFNVSLLKFTIAMPVRKACLKRRWQEEVSICVRMQLVIYISYANLAINIFSMSLGIAHDLHIFSVMKELPENHSLP